MKFNELKPTYRVGRLYITCFFVSILCSPLFCWIYKGIFDFLTLDKNFFNKFGFGGSFVFGALLSFYFFLPLLIFSIIKEKISYNWFLVLIFPVVFFLAACVYYAVSLILLFILGWLFAQLILLAKNINKKYL